MFAGQAIAHESQPGLLELKQLGPARYEVIWRAPIYYGKPHPASLALPGNWKAVSQPTVRQLPDSALHRQVVDVDGGTINGSVIRFPGLEATITDVFVRVTRLDGSEASLVVRPTKPVAVLRGERSWVESSSEYIMLGFNHILMGIDHLLFVLGLLIIVKSRRMLIKTITAFTVAHSITLAIATLGYANVPSPPLNAAIALSILFLGPEIARVWRGETSFTIRHPWVVAFGFGLLHGFGFRKWPLDCGHADGGNSAGVAHVQYRCGDRSATVCVADAPCLSRAENTGVLLAALGRVHAWLCDWIAGRILDYPAYCNDVLNYEIRRLKELLSGNARMCHRCVDRDAVAASGVGPHRIR